MISNQQLNVDVTQNAVIANMATGINCQFTPDCINHVTTCCSLHPTSSIIQQGVMDPTCVSCLSCVATQIVLEYVVDRYIFPVGPGILQPINPDSIPEPEEVEAQASSIDAHNNAFIESEIIDNEIISFDEEVCNYINVNNMPSCDVHPNVLSNDEVIMSQINIVNDSVIKPIQILQNKKTTGVFVERHLTELTNDLIDDHGSPIFKHFDGDNKLNECVSIDFNQEVSDDDIHDDDFSIDGIRLVVKPIHEQNSVCVEQEIIHDPPHISFSQFVSKSPQIDANNSNNLEISVSVEQFNTSLVKKSARYSFGPFAKLNQPTKVNITISRDLMDKLPQLIANGGLNPHALSAAIRTHLYGLVDEYLLSSYGPTAILDLYGNARTPKLLRHHTVHVHRPIITLKDNDRVKLCKDKGLYYLKFNKGKINYTEKSSYCTTNSCHTHFKHYINFVNDALYYQETYNAVINNMNTTNTYRSYDDRVVTIAIFKVFDSKISASRILIAQDKTFVDQGHWYRVDQHIMYCPNNISSDKEPNYYHPDICNTLYLQDKARDNHFIYTVIFRVNHYSEATVVVEIVPFVKSADNNRLPKVHTPVENPQNLIVIGDNEQCCVLRCLLEVRCIDPPLGIEATTTKYKNIAVASVEELNTIMSDIQGVNVVCDTCHGMYVFREMKTKFTANANRVVGRHDCPYETCAKFNHISCTEQCKSPAHMLARKDYSRYGRKITDTYYLELKALLNHLTKVTIAGKKSVINSAAVEGSDQLSQNASVEQRIAQIIEVNPELAKPIVADQRIISLQLPVQTKKGDPIEIIKPVDSDQFVARILDTKTNTYEHYTYLDGKGLYSCQFSTTNNTNIGTITFNVRTTPLILEASTLCTLTNYVTMIKGALTVENTIYIRKCVKKLHNTITEPQMLVLFTWLLQQKIREEQLTKLILGSRPNATLQAFQNNQMLYDTTFSQNCLQHGCWTALRMSLFSSCRAEEIIVDVGEMNLLEKKHFAFINYLC